MKKSLTIITILFASIALYAVEYPDSVLDASKQEYRIEKGLNFDITFGVGAGRFEFSQPWVGFASSHSENVLSLPTWTGGVGINGYFVPWMGIGAGIQFSTYSNKTKIGNPWIVKGTDSEGEDYILTSTSSDLVEQQGIYMLEVPVTLRFRAIKRNVGFHAALGGKIGLPISDFYRMSKGSLHNEVRYDHWNLPISDIIPGLIEDGTINPVSQNFSIGNSRLNLLNYAAYAEIGMLFRLQQRLDLLVALSGTYYFNDVLAQKSSTPLGFNDAWVKSNEYDSPFTSEYNGVLVTNEVQELHPWSVALKVGLSINAGKTSAQRQYLREQRLAEQEAKRQAKAEKKKKEEPLPVVPVVADTVAAPVVVHDTIYVTRYDTIRVVDTLRIEVPVEVEKIVERPVEKIVEQPVEQTVAQPTVIAETQEIDQELQSTFIWFKFDDVVPFLEPEDLLERLAEQLKRNPKQQIQINGHACFIGKSEYNRQLAMRRAMAVAKELQRLGVSNKQMIVRSMGEKLPIRHQGDVEDNKYRRVVEIFPLEEAQIETRKTYSLPTTETILSGSRLAQIARRYYGNTDYWVFIYEANSNKITDPSLVPAGTELFIPDLSERLGDKTEEEIAEMIRSIKASIKK